MNIFVINGLPETGKTKFGELVGEELSRRSVPFLHTSSILPIKHLMMPVNTWSELDAPFTAWCRIKEIRDSITELDWDGITKDKYWREVMSKFKLALLAEFPDLINEWVLAQAEHIGRESVLFVDIREPENIELFTSYSLGMGVEGVRTVLITRDTNGDFANYSDGSVMNMKYDIYIHNPGAVEGDDIFQGYREVALKFIEENVGEFRDIEIVNA